MQTLVLPPLTTLNEYLNANNRNRFIAAKIKKTETETVAWIAKSTLKPMNRITEIRFYFHVPNKKKDKDNWIFCTKFIMDGLVLAGIIPNDTYDLTPDKWSYAFEVDKEDPRIEVVLV